MSSYAEWNEMVERHCASCWAERRRVAMQYSPKCAVPYVAMVDAGTIELVRELGVEVATSANLIQYFEARWTEGAVRRVISKPGGGSIACGARRSSGSERSSARASA